MAALNAGWRGAAAAAARGAGVSTAMALAKAESESWRLRKQHIEEMLRETPYY